jgi:hypothetical protein
MNLFDDPEARLRSRHLLAALGMAAAFVVASWRTLAIPFSDAEAAFVHASLRAGGQVISPEFDAPSHAPSARALGVLEQIVGIDERALRILFVAFLAVAGCLVTELLFPARLGSAVIPLLGFLALPLLTQRDLIRPELLVVLPAGLALLAAPIGRRVTNLRGGLGLAGAVAVGAMGWHPAAVLAAVLVLVAAFRGSALDRAGAVVTAIAALATAWATGAPFAGLLPESPSLDARVALFAVVPAVLVFLATAASAVGAVARTAVALALLGLVVVPFVRPPDPGNRIAVTVLDQVRSVAIPGSALAVAGPGRVAVAVYARLGHAVPVPIVYVPEHATLADLAAFLRKAGLRQVWLHPPVADAPRGFSMPESQPASASLLRPLMLESE